MSVNRESMRGRRRINTAALIIKPSGGKSVLALAVSAALCATPQSYAQQASGSQSLEEIVVTATKRAINLQDVPQSITVLTTADIEKAGYKEMGDYIKDLPSVTLAQQQPARNDIVFRGVSTGVEDFYTDAQAAVYLDEQPLTTNATQVSPYLVDIERVESLPGPQGTLFGSSAETGVLRIITNKPDPSGFSGQYSLTGIATKDGAGSYEVDGHLNIPLTSNLTARIVGFYADNGGWIDNVYGTDLAQNSTNANVVQSNTNVWKVSGMRLAALWKVNTDWDALFNLTTQNDTTHGDWSSDPALGDAKISRFIINSRHDNWWQAAATITGDLGFAEFKSATAYFKRHMTYTEDNMTYEQYKAKYYGSYYGAYPTTAKEAHKLAPKYNVYDTRLVSNGAFTTSTVFNDQYQYRVSQEFRLTSKGDSRLQWLGGLFFERVHDWWYYGTQNLQFMDTYAWLAANQQALDYKNQGYNIQYPLAPTTTIYADWIDRTVTQTAVFGEVSYKLTDPWTVTVGGRWFNYKRATDQHYDVPLGIPVGLGAPPSTSNGNDSAELFKLGTQYKFRPDVMGYLLFSEGYRLGGENSERAAASGAVPLHYNPDKLYNYEAGIKSQWFDRHLTFNASLFYMKWKAIQLESSTSGAASGDGAWWKRGTINGGGADNLGIEVSGSWRVNKNILFDFNVISADPKLTDPVIYPNGTTIPSGTQMVGAPKFKASGGLEYDFDWKPSNSNLWARFDYSYQSLVYQNLLYASINYQNNVQDLGLIPGTGRVEPWSYGKLQIGLSMPDKTEITLSLDNVWNSKGANWVTTSEGYYAAQFTDPRYHNMPAQIRPQNIGLTFRKSF